MLSDKNPVTEFDGEALSGQFRIEESAEGFCIMCSLENGQYIIVDELMDVTCPDANGIVFLTTPKYNSIEEEFENGSTAFLPSMAAAREQLKTVAEQRRLEETDDDRRFREYLYNLRAEIDTDDWYDYSMERDVYLSWLKEQERSEMPPKPSYVNDKAYEKNTPYCLRTRSQFVCWKYELKDNRWSKIPYNPKTGQRASSVNPRTWANFETACAAVDQYGLDGVGIMFAQGIVGIDIDHVIGEDGKISERAREVIEKINSYTEYSPSGKGVHILLFGSLPGEFTRKDEFEMYSKARFFTLTGKPFENTFRKIPKAAETQDALNAMYEKYIAAGRNISNAPQPIPETAEEALSDEEIILKCQSSANADRFEKLWRGDTSLHFHKDGTPDLSLHDLALIGMLAYYTDNPAQLDRLFRKSGLMRPKWDAGRGGSTYGQDTIRYALRSRGATKYAPDKFAEQQRNAKNAEWTTIEIPQANYVKDYAKGKLFRIEEGELQGATFFYPSSLCTATETGYKLRVKKDFVFTLHKKGNQSIDLTPAELKDVLNGKQLDKKMQVKPSKKQNQKTEQFD